MNRLSKNTSRDRGYIGLIALMIGLAVVAYLMAKQFEIYSIGVREENKNQDNVVDNNLSSGGFQNLSPIEKAQNIKDVLENRDRNLLDQ